MDHAHLQHFNVEPLSQYLFIKQKTKVPCQKTKDSYIFDLADLVTSTEGQ